MGEYVRAGSTPGMCTARRSIVGMYTATPGMVGILCLSGKLYTGYVYSKT